MSDLPKPRRDGRCCDCEARPAETQDRRFCRKCLRTRIARTTPMVGCFPRNRSGDQKENTYETKHG